MLHFYLFCLFIKIYIVTFIIRQIKLIRKQILLTILSFLSESLVIIDLEKLYLVIVN
jgi:hypothetical protein